MVQSSLALSLAARRLNVDSPEVGTETARRVPRWLCAQETTLRQLERTGGGVGSRLRVSWSPVTAGAEARGVVYLWPSSYDVLELSLEVGVRGKMGNKRSGHWETLKPVIRTSRHPISHFPANTSSHSLSSRVPSLKSIPNPSSKEPVESPQRARIPS